MAQLGMTGYDLLLSNPSDVASCVPLVEAALLDFNNSFGREHGVFVRSVNWRADTYPTLGKPPQQAINEQIVSSADLVLACFWTRFGTPTEGYGSGTEEEIELLVDSGRQAFLYFLDKPIAPSQLDNDQFGALRSFRAKYDSRGIYAVVESEAALATDFRRKLELYFRAEVNKEAILEAAPRSKILWVDDQPENFSFERRLLEEYGVEFSLALTTSEAMSLLKHRKYSVIISDMQRKEGPREGYRLLDEMKAAGIDVPVVFFTSSVQPEHVAEVRAHGAQACTDDSNVLADLVLKLLLGGSVK